VTARIDEPRNERSRRTRAAVLDAAWELLEELGADGTTMAAVADRAGVSRRALYLHFSSRAELLLALHEHVDERLDLAASLQPVHEAPDAVAMLDAFAEHLGRYHPRIRELDTALLRASGGDPDVAELIDRGSRAWHDWCTAITQRLADEGRLAPPWSVGSAADLLWGLMFPELLERLLVDRGWSEAAYAERLATLLRRTLVNPQ
jgi:AcrR family transcriptional regulator